MADDFGTGVSRVLDPKKTQMTQVIWQQGKPPLDSELNLLQQLATDWRRSIISNETPSGWLGNGTNDPEAFLTNSTWSNWLKFGQQKTGEFGAIQWAAVNGWLIPVTGTKTGTPPGSPDDASTWNKITLDPPPSNSGDNRIDYVFLEVWQAKLPPNPSITNKPSASGIWKYGNVEGGYSFLADDMIDPALGFETTQRVQVQYRIRVVSGLVGLTSYPDGFDPVFVKARGAATAATSFTFTNMRKELGDAGLWRAGDGTANSLGTVDGYSYAIPLAVIFRRNSVAWDGDPGVNLNGGFNRNPTAIDRTGVKTFSTTPTLSADMTAAQLTLSLVSASNIPMPTSPASSVYIKVGDEIMQYSAITGTTMTLTARGALGSKAETHVAGETVLPVSGRPDGLFSDQIAKTDILDLRHIVNSNGFDHNTLLKGALDQCLRGTLRANWKRGGSSNPQGNFVFYQDKVSASVAALGISKLDNPDGIRQIYSDASALQPIEFIAKPPTGLGVTQNITSSWGLTITGSVDNTSSGAANFFSPDDVITIPISSFVGSLDADQVSFPLRAGSDTPLWVKIRIAGTETDLIYGTDYTITTPTGPSDDLVITLAPTFNSSTATPLALYITFYVQYGPGRGMSRRPDSVHSVAYLNATSGTLLRQIGIPANNIPVSAAYAPLWSKFRNTTLNGQIPVTAESYIDPGSKTVVLSPFRKIVLPSATFGAPATTFFQAIKDNTLHSSAGAMPNPASKWGVTTDPFGLFSGYSDSTPARSNTFVVIPRNLMPGWGAVYEPIIHTDTVDFVEGLNFGFYAPKGVIGGTDKIQNFIPFSGGSKSFTTFSTCNFSGTNPTTSATYNALLGGAIQGTIPAGMRFFTDSRGLGRQGLELPPFYGIARLFAVYEAEDFAVAGSHYVSASRVLAGSGATNLLRQDFQGPAFWIEIDEDGDSTFILNADAIDITKSPNAIADFASGNYIIEASIFGFDRGAFDLSDDCRIVLARNRPEATDANVDPKVGTIDVNLVIPAPPQGADEIAINFSRTPYQGDAFATQESQFDISQNVGPLTSGDAYQLGNTELDEAELTRPEQKVLEVLASTGFMTTLGTGRISGDFVTANQLDFRYPGYEETSSVYPPASPSDDRPLLEEGSEGPTLGTLDTLLALGTEYSGCTERLPLGSLYRDKDFRGDSIGDHPLGLVFMDPGQGMASNLMKDNNSELNEMPVFTASQAGGGPGEIVVMVDGETSAYNLLTNYRTTRGGSAFVASGNYAGGDLAAQLSNQDDAGSFNTVLVGVAYLVRNSVVNSGATERSAGQELMMLIATTAVRKHVSTPTPLFMMCGTQGTAEGFSAVDLYRISGRPLTKDGVRIGLDPSTVVLSNKISFKPRIGG